MVAGKLVSLMSLMIPFFAAFTARAECYSGPVQANRDPSAKLYVLWSGAENEFDQILLKGETREGRAPLSCVGNKPPTTCFVGDGTRMTVSLEGEELKLEMKRSALALEYDEGGELHLRPVRVDTGATIYRLKQVGNEVCADLFTPMGIYYPPPPQ